MHGVCMMNGNVDDAVYWIQCGRTRSGLTFLYIVIAYTVRFCRLIYVNLVNMCHGSVLEVVL